MGSSTRYIIFRIHPDDPDVIRLAGLTGLSVYDVIGRAAVWFRWIDEHCSSQRTDIPLEGIDQIVGRPDIPESCSTFSHAMLQVGWLTLSDDQTVHICGFDKNFSQSAKRRALDAKRKSAERNTSSGQQTDKSPPKRPSRRNSRRSNQKRDGPSDADLIEQSLLGEPVREDDERKLQAHEAGGAEPPSAEHQAWSDALTALGVQPHRRSGRMRDKLDKFVASNGGEKVAAERLQEAIKGGARTFDEAQNWIWNRDRERTKGDNHATQQRKSTTAHGASQRGNGSRGAQQRAERSEREFADDLGEIPTFRPPD